MPEVVVVKNQKGTLAVEVPGSGGRYGRRLELFGEEHAAEEEGGDGANQVKPAEGTDGFLLDLLIVTEVALHAHVICDVYDHVEDEDDEEIAGNAGATHCDDEGGH